MYEIVIAYPLAAAAEIAGCFAFWSWRKEGHSPLWVIPGIISLIFFAFCLTFVPADAAGRAFAAYGGVYIVASLIWMVVVEKTPIDAWDVLGGAISLVGAIIIIFAPKADGNDAS